MTLSLSEANKPSLFFEALTMLHEYEIQKVLEAPNIASSLIPTK